MSAPLEINSIHITDLPGDVYAGELATIFQWPVDCIVMKALPDNSLTCRECWLIDKKNELTCSEISESWSRHASRKDMINCTQEPITLELCRFFRNGECKEQNCDWEHQLCTARGSCSSSCPFGHLRGSRKTGDMPSGMQMVAHLHRYQ